MWLAEIKQMYFAVKCAAFLWNTFDKINTNNDTFKSKFALSFINPNTKENFWELLFEVESLKI